VAKAYSRRFPQRFRVWPIGSSDLARTTIGSHAYQAPSWISVGYELGTRDETMIVTPLTLSKLLGGTVAWMILANSPLSAGQQNKPTELSPYDVKRKEETTGYTVYANFNQVCGASTLVRTERHTQGT
jgi:hypothetical protein